MEENADYTKLTMKHSSNRNFRASIPGQSKEQCQYIAIETVTSPKLGSETEIPLSGRSVLEQERIDAGTLIGALLLDAREGKSDDPGETSIPAGKIESHGR